MSEASELRRGEGALKTFKKRVDGILDKLDGSAASSHHISQQEVPASALKGAGTFVEADDLHLAYKGVHENLKRLSKILGLQIEALGIAVHGADIGYDNLEEEQRRRFHALQTQIHRLSQPDDGHRNANTQKHSQHAY